MSVRNGDLFVYNTIDVPTVVGLLKNILTQYPDNGQIIKELVQNGEDAGATQVIAVHDTREFGPVLPAEGVDIQRFIKGPALCLYNDAVFTEADWKGIRRLSDSIKKNDPLKVGQFGLGFKSVFHMTDYVTIISGKYVLFMDPSEPERTMCRTLPLEKLTSIIPQEKCTELWGDYLTTQSLSNGYLPATIFWFPLRQTPSDISATIYTSDHMGRLFHSFRVEAPGCLTFLKSLEKLSLKIRYGNGGEDDLFLEVALKSSNMEQVRCARRTFKRQLEECNGSPVATLSCMYDVTISTITAEDGNNEQKLCILHYVPGPGGPAPVWHGDPSQHHMSHVGIAANMDPISSQKSAGQIFCFLPLPPEPTNNTNLPVQVHGFFSLSQNRRHVKWMTAEGGQEPDVLWNEELVRQTVMEAYSLILHVMLEKLKTNQIEVKTWYSVLPDLESTQGRWKTIASAMWSRLCHLPILYSEVLRSMITPQAAVTDLSLSSQEPVVVDAVRKCLTLLNAPLVSVAQSILKSLSSLAVHPVDTTPRFLREKLKHSSNHINEWDWNSRVLLLQYILFDEDYGDLEHIPLLPLNNGEWITFSRFSQPTFICTREEACAFLGMDGEILSVDLPSSIMVMLRSAASESTNQLRIFNASVHGAALLERSTTYIEKAKLSSNQLKSWLPWVWRLLQNVRLEDVDKLSLVPTSSDFDSTTLIPLSSPIVKQNNDGDLSKACIDILSLLNVQVIQELPSFVTHFQLLRYFAGSDTEGVTQVLNRIANEYDLDSLKDVVNSNLSEAHIYALCQVLDISRIQANLKTLLKGLRLFRGTNNTHCVFYTSIDICQKIAPANNSFPFVFPETLIIPVNENRCQLAVLLGAIPLLPEDLFLLAMESAPASDREFFNKLIEYALNNSQLLNDMRVRKKLQESRFVPTEGQRYLLPCEAYDPEDSEREALLGEDLYPSQTFQKHLPILRELGLKTVQGMPQENLIAIGRQLQSVQLTKENKIKKASSLFMAINRRQDCRELCHALKDAPCIYGVSTKPERYPKNLQWETCSDLITPKDAKCELFKDICGSVIPLVPCSHIPHVAEAFGWKNEPNVDKVVNHLQNIINSYQEFEFEYRELIKNTYRYLAQHVTSSTLAALQSLPSVFTEYGFRRPKEVYTSAKKGDIDLQPYLYPLLFDLREHSSFFLNLGCFQSQSTELYLFLLGEIQNRHVTGEEVNAEDDRSLVISILRKLQHNIKDIDPSQLLLPIETEDGSLRLMEIGKCSYSSEACEWLDSEELSVSIVHRDVGTALAESLGVESLSKHMLAGEEAFMEWGQYEPLTTRLHNLLRQYRDGLAIFKEMVQNADDAGATTVSFLYDERLNKDSHTRLINPKLQECQGPALWVYNDANFTEVDFENLRRLGGATKEHQPTKIGKFGLGFSTVYNLTDVPSFVSGSSYVIFDPHLSYVEGKNQTPGVRYNFANKKNEVMLKKLSGQFKPFKKIFDCDIQNAGRYDGTLFRLPLRTPQQAVMSDICKISYQREEMLELLEKFSDIIGEILLFTQNVKEIKVFHLQENTLPEDKVLLMESSRKEEEKTRIHQDMLIGVSSAGNVMECVGKLFNEDHTWKQEEFHQNIVFNITVTHTANAAKLCNIKHNINTVTWFTSWHTGHGDSCRLAELKGKALPIGAVAAPLKKVGTSWEPIELEKLPCGFYKKSHMHCFLPLPVSSSLMVQINGFFEVASDRTSLSTRTEDDRVISQDWNTTLIRDAVTAAYHTLLTTIRLKGLGQNCKYYALWPLCEEVHDNLASELSQSFYKFIVENNLTVFRDDIVWLPFSKCLFLEESIHQTKLVGKYAFNFMRNLLEASVLKIAELPGRIAYGFAKNIIPKIITPEKFFECYFIPNMREEFAKGQREILTLHALDHYPNIAHQQKDIFYIPSTPNGTLKKADELILPNTQIASLYEVSDERFPEDIFLNDGHRKDILIQLGVMTSRITVEMLHERAQTVKDLSCTMCGIRRASEILKYIDSNDKDILPVISKEIKDISFLPVMPKPKEWIVCWRGDSFPPKLSRACKIHKGKHTSSCDISFSKPDSMCFQELRSLAGSTHVILDKSDPNFHARICVFRSLGIITKARDLPSEAAINQLNIFRKESKDNWLTIREQCHQIYKYLDSCIKDNGLDVANLIDQKILLTKFGFIKPKHFILSSHENCAPDLFSVETENLGQYRHLMKALNIKEHFHPTTVLKILLSKKRQHNMTRLSDEEVCQISRLLHLLFKEMDYSTTEEEMDLSQLHLPDSDGCLVPVGQLCIDDNAMLSSGKFKYLNEKFSLPQNYIERLGLKTKSRKRLEESCNRLAFGQHELLTTRLRNILREYPCDSGIMKEMLQNADDAGASEISFIKDFRHHSDQKIIDKTLAPLQGPALCVYNNRCFQEKDIRGIQNLGDSSKEKDPASTGQYGIGFNAVYHLTDAPSFLTRGPDTLYGEDQRETLCLFDPHCWYDPLATKEYPGAQYVNLKDLRKDYPDSFSGYLDEVILKEEGTIFRLPLRTRTDSQISSNVMTPSELESKIEEFKKEMKMCLLFLRSVRKISIKHMNENGECVDEFCVESYISDEDENKIREMRDDMSQRRQTITNKNNLDEYFLKMTRISYKMEVKNTHRLHDHWLVTQQLGAENSLCLPSEEIQEEFLVGSFNLLPHAGVAILLDSTSKIDSEQMATSCYLPLPAKSGLPFSVNGHFILNSSRRDLWTGKDLRVMWNEWLMKEVMIPAAVQTVTLCQEWIFSGIKETVAYGDYRKKAGKFYCILPNTRKINEKWKKFPHWFFEYVHKHQIPIFNVFTPHRDISASDDSKHGTVAMHVNFFMYQKIMGYPQRNSALEELKGTLTRHSLTKDGDQFPLYFSDGISLNLLNSLKRLGMKIGTKTMEERLKHAEVSYSKLTPDAVLGFFSSWTSGYPDRCMLNVENHIETTPILSDENACEIFSYLFMSKKFVQAMNNFPLLLTEDQHLHVFSEVKPVFISSYTNLLPHSKYEFLHSKMAKIVWEPSKSSLSVLKPFSVSDFAARIETVLDQSFKNTTEMKLCKYDELLSKEWLKLFWNFVTEDIKQNFKSGNSVDWVGGKKNLLAVLGDWALYPITVNKTSYIIPIKYAYCVLQTEIYNNSFKKLPIPHPDDYFEIPIELRLAATLDNPEAVLRALHFHRNEIGANAALRNRVENNKILEYFGEEINKGHYLSQEQLRSLPLYENISGKDESLTDKKIIVPETTNIKSENFKHFIEGNDIALLKATSSETLKYLYIYLDPSCIMKDLEIYRQYVLPNLKDMDSEEKVKHLKFLRDELERLKYRPESSWPTEERNVVTQLRRTPFILVEGSLQTADQFYDPINPVFKVMGLCNLPDEWLKLEWLWFLKLAGMKDEISSKMFLKYIKSLSITDPNVEVKSKTLADHLFSNQEQLKDAFCEIRDIEFIVPFKCHSCESISSHYQTSSGLTSFSKSYPQELAELVWTSACLLPDSHKQCDKEMIRCLNISSTPSGDTIFNHIRNICTELQEKYKSGKKVSEVMTKIYQYLMEAEDDFLNRIVNAKIPIIHLPDLKTCVTTNLVVIELFCNLEPYLYKAPVEYGLYFTVFKRMGVLEKTTVNTYAKTLNMISKNSQNNVLHPEEVRCVKIALRGMLKLWWHIKDIEVCELYLLSKDMKLVLSSCMYVADNPQFEEALRKTLNKPLLMSFNSLENCDKTDVDFVKLLPESLRPTFLSSVVEQEFKENGIHLENSQIVEKSIKGLATQEFKTAVLRIFNHASPDKLCKENEKELLDKLEYVYLKTVAEITINLKFQGQIVGTNTFSYGYHIDYFPKNETNIIIYLCQPNEEKFLLLGLSEVFRKLFRYTNDEMNEHMLAILMSLEEPSEIHQVLDRKGIKAYLYSNAEDIVRMYKSDVGSYLDVDFIHLLNNELCRFHEGELVCMKKYIYGELLDPEEEDIFIIVQIKRQVTSFDNPIHDEYEVNTGSESEPLKTVKAYMLYKFIRKTTTCRDVVLRDSVPEEDDEDAIMKSVRIQMIEIWKVEDLRNRKQLLRRLMLKWHPDKNPEKVELATRVMQYIQSLLSRLERGEIISENESHNNFPRSQPSSFYEDIFRSPPSYYREPRSSSSGRSFYSNFRGPSPSSYRNQEKMRMPDKPEARKWLKQAKHDLEEAERRRDGSDCWITYMCHQAAEKVLKAALYLEDRDTAQSYQSGSECHSLTAVARHLSCSNTSSLATDMQFHVGHHTNLRYPTSLGSPCDRYTKHDAEFMLEKAASLMETLKPRFQSL
ncbi:sacsin-like [Penaeus chinensis]|uniref:sacsin-like n=1 Tax=Penaeus chinensis TaxID=139456 RepID=UPI001FB8296F|nr:sacsin-like [Penaeus chinensis]